LDQQLWRKEHLEESRRKAREKMEKQWFKNFSLLPVFSQLLLERIYGSC
jgi:hypothetical protein